MDYMADYNEAQASGLHHEDCDGYYTAHRVEIEEIRYSNGSKSYKAVCDDCGALSVGSFGQREDCVRLQAGHSHEAKCDGRCKLWSTAA